MTIARRMRAHPGMLACALAGLFASTPGAFAQDPAAVDDRYDPAFVGGLRAPPRRAQAEATPPSAGAIGRQDDLEDVESLLKRVHARIDGATVADAAAYDSAATADDLLRYRGEVEDRVRAHWNALSPATRGLYASEYGRSQPDENGSRSSPAYTAVSPERSELLRGVGDATDALRGLESLLLPMLQDLKQAADATLLQNANRR